MNKLLLVCFFLMYLVLLTITVSSVFFVSVIELDLLVYEKLNIITIASFLIFVASALISSVNKKLLSAGLIFTMVAAPSAVNNIFPAIMLGIDNERGVSSFPLFTSIELLILLILYRYRNSLSIKISKKQIRILIAVLIFLMASFTVNVFKSKDLNDFMLLLAGTYHIKIFLLLSFLYFSLDLNLKYALYGLALSIIFLFVESCIFSFSRGLPHLASGSLATNSFGNIIAASSIALLIYVYRNKNIKVQSSTFFYICLFVGFVSAILTETRMAIIASLLSITIIYFTPSKMNTRILVFTIFLVLFSVFAYLFLLHLIPSNYRFDQIIADIPVMDILLDQKDKRIKITPDNSSIITRLKLFSTSLNMFSENSLFGIGHGRWNWYKYDYGYENKVLIDSHNGYLANISQYGISAIPLLYFLFILPLIGFKKRLKFFRQKIKGDQYHFQFSFIAISLTILFAEFSNTGTFKIQIFSLLVFSSLVVLENQYPSKHNFE